MDVPVGYCGTGAAKYPIQPNTDYTFLIALWPFAKEGTHGIVALGGDGIELESEPFETLAIREAAPGDEPTKTANSTLNTSGWRKLVSCDIAKDASRKADIGNHAIVYADGGASGWDIEVRRYPLKSNTENLLYDGNNWHGLQPWNVRPQFITNNPAVEIATYNKGQSQLMIVACNCQTRTDASNRTVFVKGTLELYHKP
jgi:hypothetical protein